MSSEDRAKACELPEAHGGDRTARGFTLVEMLAVIAIAGVMLSLVVPAVRSVSESGNLTRGGQVVNDQISLARQMATARNITVEVRLFKTASSTVGYTAMQLWVSRLTPPAAAIMVPLDKVYLMPTGIAISENTNLSQMLTLLPAPTTMQQQQQQGILQQTGPMQNNLYVAFQLRPQGSVTPVFYSASATANTSSSIMSGVYLTVVPVRFAGPTLPSPLPKNYVTVQVNPYTGTPLVYRP